MLTVPRGPGDKELIFPVITNSLEQKLGLIVPSLLQVLAQRGFWLPGFLEVEEPEPRPLVGRTGLGGSVGAGGGGGMYLVVGTGGCAVMVGGLGLTSGYEGMVLVLVWDTSDDTEDPCGRLVYSARNPSEVTLRSDTNWTSNTFPLVIMGAGAWSPQYFPISCESSLSPPL